MQAAFPGAAVIRPAVMFAPDDAFLTTILGLLRTLPAYPLFGDGGTRLQPVYVDDVAAAIAQVLRQTQRPFPIYELAGPRVYSYEELLRTIARTAGLRPMLVRIPFAFWNAAAGLAEILPHRRSRAIRLSLCRSTRRPRAAGRDFGLTRISPRSLEEELKAMLKHTNEETQNTNEGRAR